MKTFDSALFLALSILFLVLCLLFAWVGIGALVLGGPVGKCLLVLGGAGIHLATSIGMFKALLQS